MWRDHEREIARANTLFPIASLILSLILSDHLKKKTSRRNFARSVWNNISHVYDTPAQIWDRKNKTKTMYETSVQI